MNVDCLAGLIDAFYAASAEPERWPETAAHMASFFASESTAIQVRGGGFSYVAWRATTANYDQTAQQEYASYYYQLDPFANGWREIGTPGIFAGHELVAPEVFRKSEIYNDYCRQLGIFHTLGAGEDLGDATKLVLGIHRPIEREDFTSEDRQCLKVLLPHLSRAVHMRTLLAAADLQQHLTYRIFDALAVAAIIVDAKGGIAYANHVADRFLALGDGLTIRQGRLTTRDANAAGSLQRRIVSASRISAGGAAPAGGVIKVRRSRKRPLLVSVVPFRKDSWADGSANASAIVFATDPESRRPSATAALSALYELTPAQARLLEALLRGERIAEYADKAGISIHTANTQLKQIFWKTGTNRQSDLIRQMLSDPTASLVQEGL